MLLSLKKQVGVVLFLMMSVMSFSTVADELVKQIQQDLNSLGYVVGTPDGVMGVKTQMAIGKFQKSKGLPVDGKASIGVAIAISEAKDSGQVQTATTSAKQSVDASQDAVVTQQEACLKQKAEQVKADQKPSMFGALTDIAGSMLSTFGQHEMLNTLRQAQSVAEQAEAVSQLAKDYGLTEDQVNACINTAVQ